MQITPAREETVLQEEQQDQTTSFDNALRSYQALFAKQIYEAGIPANAQNRLRQEYQKFLGNQELDKVEAPIIEFFETDCQQYRRQYISELYSMGRVSKTKLTKQQQQLCLGAPVIKQLVRQIHQEFRQACGAYRTCYAADLRDDGQVNTETLSKERDKWRLGKIVVDAIASTEDLTFANDQKNYRKVAAQTIHQYGRLDSEALRSRQRSCNFGATLLDSIHKELGAEFQSHQQTYQQAFLSLLYEKGNISTEDRSTLNDLRQSLGNLNASILAEFEQTAIQTHEYNVLRYTEEAKNVLQQFSQGNCEYPMPPTEDAKTALAALRHWYQISDAIAIPIEETIRLTLKPTLDVSENHSPQAEESKVFDDQTTLESNTTLSKSTKSTKPGSPESNIIQSGGTQSESTQSHPVTSYQIIPDPWTTSNEELHTPNNITSNHTELVSQKDDKEPTISQTPSNELPSPLEESRLHSNSSTTTIEPISTVVGETTANHNINNRPNAVDDPVKQSVEQTVILSDSSTTETWTEHGSRESIEENVIEKILEVPNTPQPLSSQTGDIDDPGVNDTGVRGVMDHSDSDIEITDEWVANTIRQGQLALKQRLVTISTLTITGLLLLGGAIAFFHKQKSQPPASTPSTESLFHQTPDSSTQSNASIRPYSISIIHN